MLTQAQIAASSPGISTGYSKPVSAWRVFKSTVIKDLQIWKRYKANLIAGLVESVMLVGVFALFSNMMQFRSGETVTEMEMFTFFLGGLLLVMMNGPALWTPLNAVTRDLYNGTLEYLYINPSSRYAYFVGTVAAGMVVHALWFTPIFFLLAYFSGANLLNLGVILTVCALAVIVLIAIGILMALTAIMWRQVSSIAQVLNMLFQFLSGAFIPLGSMPTFVRYAAFALPQTWANDLIRYYSFDGDWDLLAPIWLEWVLLGCFAVFFVAISKYLLRRVERHAKKNGLHLI